MNHCEGNIFMVLECVWKHHVSKTKHLFIIETKGSQSKGAEISIFRQTTTVILCLLAPGKKEHNYCHPYLFIITFQRPIMGSNTVRCINSLFVNNKDKWSNLIFIFINAERKCIFTMLNMKTVKLKHHQSLRQIS